MNSAPASSGAVAGCVDSTVSDANDEHLLADRSVVRSIVEIHAVIHFP